MGVQQYAGREHDVRARVRVVSLRVFRVRASMRVHKSTSATRVCLKVGALPEDHTRIWAGCALARAVAQSEIDAAEVSTGRLWWLCFSTSSWRRVSTPAPSAAEAALRTLDWLTGAACA